MLYTQQHLKDAMLPKNPKNSHHHGLDIDMIKSIPEKLAEPAIIFDSISPHKKGNGSIIAVLDMYDSDNAPIIVSISPNGSGIYQLERVDSNFITSIYGKDNGFENYISKAAENGNILYWNKNKSQELFSCQGLQLPEAINNLDFNIIIHQSRNIVKANDEKNIEYSVNNDAEMQLAFDIDTTQPQQEKSEIIQDNTTKTDFTITDDKLGEGGAKTKFRANVEAIKTLKAIEADGRTATPEEQEILSMVRCLMIRKKQEKH